MNEHSFPPSEVYVTLPLFWITPWSKVIAMYQQVVERRSRSAGCAAIRGGW